MANYSLCGPVSGYTEIKGYDPKVNHDPIGAALHFTLDFKKLLVAAKASTGNSSLTFAAGDKFLIAPTTKGCRIEKAFYLTARVDSGTPSAKANGANFTLGNTSASFGTYYIKSSAASGTIAEVAVPATWLTNDYLAAYLPAAVDASNDLPVDGAVEVVVPFLAAFPAVNATGLTGVGL